jgi:membrane associated rhomboid family serine protease
MGSYARSSYVSHNPNLPPAVKWLLIVNTALFVLYFFAARTSYGSWFYPFGLSPRWVIEGLAVWQFVTYLFLHSPGGFDHILLNMLSLWMFGKDLENTWGTRRFLQYYFFCGIGAGVLAVILNLLFGNRDSWTIGASGAIYGLLLAFGVLFPDAKILFNFLFPIKAKYFVMIVGAISFMMTFRQTGDSVSHVAHLGGMLFGFLYIKGGLGGIDLIAPAAAWYRNWKHERAKRKFQVYIRKNNDRDRTIH